MPSVDHLQITGSGSPLVIKNAVLFPKEEAPVFSNVFLLDFEPTFVIDHVKHLTLEGIKLNLAAKNGISGTFKEHSVDLNFRDLVFQDNLTDGFSQGVILEFSGEKEHDVLFDHVHLSDLELGVKISNSTSPLNVTFQGNSEFNLHRDAAVWILNDGGSADIRFKDTRFDLNGVGSALANLNVENKNRGALSLSLMGVFMERGAADHLLFIKNIFGSNATVRFMNSQLSSHLGASEALLFENTKNSQIDLSFVNHTMINHNAGGIRLENGGEGSLAKLNLVQSSFQDAGASLKFNNYDKAKGVFNLINTEFIDDITTLFPSIEVNNLNEGTFSGALNGALISDGRGLSLHNISNGTLDFLIANSNINGSSQNGVFVTTDENATTRLEMLSSVVSGSTGTGVYASTSKESVLDFNAINSTFKTNLEHGLEFIQLDGAKSKIVFENSQIEDNQKIGLRAITDGVNSLANFFTESSANPKQWVFRL